MLEQLANQIITLTHLIEALIYDLGRTNNELTKNRILLQIDAERKNLEFVEDAYTNLYNEEMNKRYENISPII